MCLISVFFHGAMLGFCNITFPLLFMTFDPTLVALVAKQICFKVVIFRHDEHRVTGQECNQIVALQLVRVLLRQMIFYPIERLLVGFFEAPVPRDRRNKNCFGRFD
jgi:hypothetical protein